MAFPANTKQVVLHNSKREFVFKIINTDSSTIALADMAHAGVTPSGANVLRAFWSQDVSGNHHIEMTRGTLGAGAVELLDLHGVGNFDFESAGMELTERNTLPLNVAVSSGGAGHHFTIIVFLRKF